MDAEYMKMALRLAERGAGYVSPNPIVGCVIVKGKTVIGSGYHEVYGGPHAERKALESCREDPEGAVLYVTLEPCSHYGKTPPCTEAIIKNKIARVVIGAVDKNPLVSGKGIEMLRKHGIMVTQGVLEKECERQNEIYFHYIKHRRPFTTMKYAMTLDGNISTRNGDSKWVTGAEARNHVQTLRRKYSAIMVGINTVIADNPMLNCRIAEGIDPVRVICDSNLNIPFDSNIVKTAKEIRTLIAYSEDKRGCRNYLEQAGIEMISCPKEEKVDLEKLMEHIGSLGIDSLLLEGGGRLNSAMIEAGLVDKVYAYVAAKLLGGTGKGPVSGNGMSYMKDAYELYNQKISVFGTDYLIEGYLKGGERCLQE